MKRTAEGKVLVGTWVVVALALVALAAAGVAWWALAQLARDTRGPEIGAPVERPEVEPRRLLRLATFADLPGWNDDHAAEALPALRQTCSRWVRLPGDRRLGDDGLAGTPPDWRAFCDGLAGLGATDHQALRQLVERELVPLLATDNGDPEGMFTGYYEPTLRGSRRRGGGYTVPLHMKPPDLVAVDLGKFRDNLAGQRIAGRLQGGELLPFADRSAIVGGALAGRELELVWVDDPVDAFFLQIQGSGRVEVEGGRVMRVGYAGQNGHPYYAIGRELVERGALAKEEVSMQSIRHWLEENPEQAEEVMSTNASYVFFRDLGAEGPFGSFGVPLTPGRSLAVDPLNVPMGAPVFVATTAPDPDPESPPRPFRRLMVAQDTGGAIRGPVRGDVFWGPGDEAAEVAGRMANRGRIWILIPRGVEPPEEEVDD